MKNTIRLYAALSVLALLAVSGSGYAQKKKDILPYGYGNTVELSAGPSWTIGSRYPNALSMASSSGCAFNMRYSYFFDRHFGIYAGFNLMEQGLSSGEYFSLLDKGAAYQARNCRILEDYAGVSIGGVYRYDFGRWSLRPRVGIGYTSYSTFDFDYYRFGPDVNLDPEHIYIMYPACNKDYVSIEASVQVCFTVGRHFFFMAEAGAVAVPGRIESRQQTYETRTPPPSSWNEALLETYKNKRLDTVLISDNSRTNPVGSLVYVRFGIGWNIGFNRNTNNYYSK
ncbi:MAG: hypothetical protein K2J62_05205 [Bacteroidales bacterium]|nr:hypothetical protein [Bacteroidales bacterium]